MNQGDGEKSQSYSSAKESPTDEQSSNYLTGSSIEAEDDRSGRAWVMTQG
jgi:hypothetical protein